MPTFRTITDQREIATAGTLTPVYARRIFLKNFRCFKGENVLDLTAPNGAPARWTVILGENGTGKTTLLESIASSFPVTYVSQQVDRETDQLKGPLQFSTHTVSPSKKSLFELIPENHLFRIESEFHIGPLERKSRQVVSVTSEPTVIGRLDEFLKSLEGKFTSLSLRTLQNGVAFLQHLNAPKSLNKPYYSLLAAYGAHRLSRTGQMATLSEEDDAGPTATLFSPFASLRSAEEWLLQVDYASRIKKRKRKTNQHRLSLVKDALLKLLPEVHDIKVVPPTDGSIPSVQFVTRFGALPLRQLSLGYQTMIAWLVDLASRMMDHYPIVDNFLEQPAVVLIDEIDLHMHPRWQREIMQLLSDVFPKVQFIATSHSPLIVQSAPDPNTVVLRIEGDRVIIHNDPALVHGWRVDQILTSDLFGLGTARPPEMERWLARRRAIMTKPEISEQDRRELEEIDTQLGQLPVGETSEDAHALDIISRAAKRLSIVESS